MPLGRPDSVAPLVDRQDRGVYGRIAGPRFALVGMTMLRLLSRAPASIRAPPRDLRERPILEGSERFWRWAYAETRIERGPG
jgi:hypothetical protein